MERRRIMAEETRAARPWLPALESIQSRMEGTTEEEALAALLADERAAAASAAMALRTHGSAVVVRLNNYAPERSVRVASASTRTS
jgi:hypothetical protein